MARAVARAPPDRRPSSATKRSSRHRINRQWPEPGTHDLNRGAWTYGRRSAALTASFGPHAAPRDLGILGPPQLARYGGGDSASGERLAALAGARGSVAYGRVLIERSVRAG